MPRSIDRSSGATGTALRVLAVLLGVFFVFQGIGKAAWLADSGLLADRLDRYLADASPIVRWYLETVAMPGVPAFARLVPAGEIATGLALVTGFWTRLAAALAFLMVLNFHVASSAVFEYSFLTDGFGLPVLSGLLALAIGGTRLPYSLTS